MNKLRLSYTLINCWMRGRKDEAIAQYLHMDRYVTPAMQRGIEFDRYVTDYALEHKCLPVEFGGKQLTDPKGHHQIVVELDERMDLKVEYDLLDIPNIIEIKNSTAEDSAQWSDSLQLSIYFFAAQLSGLKVKKAELYRFDPAHKKADMSVVWMSHRRIEDAVNAINQCGPEIYNYFSQEGIL